MHELLLGVLLGLTIIWLVVRMRRNKAESSKKAHVSSDRSVYSAVALQYSENSCDAAKAMTGRRFLSSAAPRLPLPECDSLDCRCQFVNYDDRRTGRDRRTPFAAAGSSSATGSFERERRSNIERRNSTSSGAPKG